MARVRPLRGIRFDSTRVALGQALAPPYDVISDAERDRLYARDLRNIVRIDYGADLEGDVAGVRDRYTRAAEHLESWLGLGLLRRDPEPTIYVHDHSFVTEDGRSLTRRGLFARVRALPWEEADVIPHERTMRGPKEDRLRLMRATRAQTSAVLLVWDRAPGLAELLARATARPPDEAAGSRGEVDREEHRLWAVDDPHEVLGVVEALAGSRLYMADGHHRFETAAAYAAERAAAEPAAGGDSDFAWTLAHLCDATDPALEVLPTHRLVLPRAAVPRNLDELGARLPERLAMERLGSLEEAVGEAARRRADLHAVAVLAADGAALVTAERRRAASPRARLDVSFVEDELIGAACGIGPADITAGALGYARRVDDAAAAVGAGTALLAVCLNGCTTQEIIDVSDAGEQMPQKSTYFYPKVPTGLVLNPL